MCFKNAARGIDAKESVLWVAVIASRLASGGLERTA